MSTNDIKAVVVLKELYYHEVAYVRALEELANATGELLNDLPDFTAEGFAKCKGLVAKVKELEK